MMRCRGAPNANIDSSYIIAADFKTEVIRRERMNIKGELVVDRNTQWMETEDYHNACMIGYAFSRNGEYLKGLGEYSNNLVEGLRNMFKKITNIIEDEKDKDKVYTFTVFFHNARNFDNNIFINCLADNADMIAPFKIAKTQISSGSTYFKNLKFVYNGHEVVFTDSMYFANTSLDGTKTL